MSVTHKRKAPQAVLSWDAPCSGRGQSKGCHALPLPMAASPYWPGEAHGGEGSCGTQIPGAAIAVSAFQTRTVKTKTDNVRTGVIIFMMAVLLSCHALGRNASIKAEKMARGDKP